MIGMDVNAIPYQTVSDSSGCIALARKGTFLYCGGASLCVYDISEPLNPRKLWEERGFGFCRQMLVAGERLYVTARQFGLWIFDLAEPAAPRLLSHYDTVELATGIAVAGSIVFVTLRIYGVEILDCSDPRRPRHLALQRTQEAQSAFYEDGLLFVGNWAGAHISVLDVSNPRRPRLLSTAALGGYGDGLALHQGFCYAATGLNARGIGTETLLGNGHGLDVFRVQGTALEPVARVDFPPLMVKTNDFWTVRACGQTAFVADTHNGVFRIDVADPRQPRCTGRLQLPGISRVDARREGQVSIQLPDCAGSIAIGDGVLYVAGASTGLHIAPMTEARVEETPAARAIILPATPAEKSPGDALSGMRCLDLGGQVRRLALKGDVLYAACSHAGVRVLHLQDQEAESVAGIKAACAYDVAVRDDCLYVAEGLEGLAVYSLQEPYRELGRWRKSNCSIQTLHLSDNGRFAVCGNHSGTLQFFDIRDLGAIELAWQTSHGGLLYGDTLPDHEVQDLLPVIWPYCGLAWYDLAGEKPQLCFDDRNNCLGGQCEGLCRFGERFLMTTLDQRFLLLDPQDLGQNPQQLAALSACSGVPSVDGNIVAFAQRRDGAVQLYQISGAGTATLIPERCLQGLYGTPDRVLFHRGRMLIPCGQQGLLWER